MIGSGQVKRKRINELHISVDLTPSSKSMLLSISQLSFNQLKKNYLRTRNRLVCAEKSYFSDITSFEP